MTSRASFESSRCGPLERDVTPHSPSLRGCRHSGSTVVVAVRVDVVRGYPLGNRYSYQYPRLTHDVAIQMVILEGGS